MGGEVEAGGRGSDIGAEGGSSLGRGGGRGDLGDLGEMGPLLWGAEEGVLGGDEVGLEGNEPGSGRARGGSSETAAGDWGMGLLAIGPGLLGGGSGNETGWGITMGGGFITGGEPGSGLPSPRK